MKTVFLPVLMVVRSCTLRMDNYSNVTISYGGSYKTNDLIEDSRPLDDITVVNLDIYGLFVDPANGDFHIKQGAGFAGTGVAGDPRWF